MFQNPGVPIKGDRNPMLPQSGFALRPEAAMKRSPDPPPASRTWRVALFLLLCVAFPQGTSTPLERYSESSNSALSPNAAELVMPPGDSKINRSRRENETGIRIKERAETLPLLGKEDAGEFSTPIQPGETKTGNIAAANQVDTYQFSAQSGESVTILMESSSSVRTILELHGPDGSVLTTAGGNAFSAYVQAFRLTQTGTYLILCRSYAFTGNYAVTLIKNPGPNVADPDGGTILPGDTKTCNLGVAEIDVFDFAGQSGDFVTIRMQSNSSVRTILELHGPDGSVLTTAGGNDFSATIENFILPSSGIYLILSRSFAFTGGYSVTFNKRSSSQCDSFSLSPPSIEIQAAGGIGTVNVTGNPAGCTENWTAASNTAWITITGGGAGSGNGTVSYMVAANGDPSSRVGTLSIAGQVFAITQAGTSGISTPYGWVMNPSNGHYYRLSSQLPWLQAEAQAMLWGGHLVTINDQNEELWLRSQFGTQQIFWIGFNDIQVEGQWRWSSGEPATYTNWWTWEPTNNWDGFEEDAAMMNWGGGTLIGGVWVQYYGMGWADARIEWGYVGIVERNTAPNCSFAIEPQSQQFPAGGGVGTLNLTATPGCSWVAENVPDWIWGIDGPDEGSGVAHYGVAPNPTTQPRSATMLLSGMPLTVNQAAGTSSCSYAIDSNARYFPAAGGSGAVGVTTQAGCAWSAWSDTGWLAITSGSGGTGSGTVSYTVSANDSTSLRTGTLNIAGKTFTVTQAAKPVCSYWFSSSEQLFTSSGGTGSVSVITQPDCGWTASSNAGWITITAGNSGSGNGAVSYAVAANNGLNVRSGTISVAGQTFTVIQAGSRGIDVGSSTDITVAQSEPMVVEITVAEGVPNLFVLLKKSSSWHGSLELLNNGNSLKSVTGSQDFAVQLQSTLPGRYLLRIAGSGSGKLSVSTSLPNLKLGEWTVGTILRSWGSAWYEIHVPADQQMLSVAAETLGLWSALKVSYGALDASPQWSAMGDKASLQIQTPVAGTYYAWLSDSAWFSDFDRPRDHQIKADVKPIANPPAMQPTISSIDPLAGGTSGQITITVKGGGFSAEAKVWLARQGESDLNPQMIRSTDDGKCLWATFDLSSAKLGQWAVKVMNADGKTATAPSWFLVNDGGESSIWVDIIGRTTIRVGRESEYTVRIGNSGEVDEEDIIVNLRVPAELEIVRVMNASGMVIWDRQEILKDIDTGKKLFPQQWSNITDEEIKQFIRNSTYFWLPEVQAGSTTQLSLILRSSSDQDPVLETLVIAFGNMVAKSFAQHFLAQTIGVIWDEKDDTVWEAIAQILRNSIRETISDYDPRNLAKWLEKGLFELLGTMVRKAGSDLFLTEFSEILTRYGVPYDKAIKVGQNAQDFLQSQLGIDKQTLGFAKNMVALLKVGIEADKKIHKAADETRAQTNKADKEITPVTSISPEDKCGPGGYDGEGTLLNNRRRFVSGMRDLAYRIDFWNREDAPAPTQDVIITDQLDTDLDWSRLSFTEFGFLQWRVPLEGGPYFKVEVDLRPDMNLIVQVEGSFDLSTGTIRWQFHSLDPITRRPPEDPMAGFLPPITDTGYEIGWVNYTVHPKAGLPTGTRVENQAFVKFDIDVFKPAPADGPFVNTIDAGTPHSAVGSLPGEQNCSGISLNWSGSDDSGGSGIKGYTIYVADNGGPYQAWLVQTTATSAVYPGQSGHTYAFYSIAEDNVGNREAAPSQPDAAIRISGQLTLSPATQHFAPIGGAGSIVISTSAGCPWTVISNASWITVASGGSGFGNGTVFYSVATNTNTSGRTGSVTVGGQTLTVSQSGNSAACTFAVSPLSQAFGALGGSGSANVSTQYGCVWTAASAAPWLTVMSGENGSGNGIVSFSVSANASPISRAVALSVAGQYFTVSQAGIGGQGFTSIFYPRLANSYASAASQEEIEYTGIAVANLGNAAATLTFTAFDASGALISGSGITNPANLELKAGEQIPIMDFQLFGSGLLAKDILGWIRVESEATKIVGFYQLFNQTVAWLDGTDVSSRTSTTFVLPEIEDSGMTWIQVANPDIYAATFTFDLMDGAGILKSRVFRNVSANGFVAEAIGDLFPGVIPMGSDYVRVFATSNAVPLELLSNPGRYLKALNGQDALGGSTTLYAPQYAAGGADWNTTLSVINLDPWPGWVTFRLADKDGVPIGIPQSRFIAGRGKLHITDQDFFLNHGNSLIEGSVEIYSNGLRLAGSVVFGDPDKNRYASALPLVSTFPSPMVFSQVASDKEYYTGLALLNSNYLDVRATIEVFRKNGTLLASTQEWIPPRGRISKVLTEYFPSLAGQEIRGGYIKVTTDLAIAGYAVFGNQTALSAVPPQIIR